MMHSTPQAYKIPETGAVIKVERIRDGKHVAHFPEGPERVGRKEIDLTWEHLGTWEKYELDKKDQGK